MTGFTQCERANTTGETLVVFIQGDDRFGGRSADRKPVVPVWLSAVALTAPVAIELLAGLPAERHGVAHVRIVEER